MTGNLFGEFLRARRARLRPVDVGLTSYGRRRVTGLRREEVAVLAGMNADYYARLEQGRERGPSPQILDALSGALQLDDATREHLYRLAGAQPGQAPQPRRTVDPTLKQLLDGYAHTPAFVLNPALDFLTANALACALFSPFQRRDNLALMTFLDPVARRFHRQWSRAAEATVASLRHATGLHPHYPRLNELVRSLVAESAEFAELWRSHAVRGKANDTKELIHPEAGPLSLNYQTFDVPGAYGQQVVVYHAPPNSPTAEALTLLGTLDATRRQNDSAAARNRTRDAASGRPPPS
ncbi:helix-turn-helix transcriptional regulator [Microlunatus parietis]|uniref:Transcriptional regulator with XRE-family HTH domain n=1 Tax=Microlunatus parietis TaxID=682979 RepID=A0A7Y9I6L9_9ACTN|nr:helix-turn-helix transcriptional regulator [Microlunatus parietis]NYE70714.1 transcriptional regulator with XRE-family HTH domain [Microlunatus parietis]